MPNGPNGVEGKIDITKLPGDLFPFDILAEAVRELRLEVKTIKQKLSETAVLEDLESGEPGMEISFQNPLMTAQGQFYQVRVNSVTSDQGTVYGTRLIPSTDATSPWKDDPSFSSRPLTGKVPLGVIPPTVGMICLFHFTGLSSGQSQYAVYTPSGIKRVKVKAVDTNVLTCIALTDAGNETGPEFLVAKPWELRRSTFHGQTINSVTYTGLTAQRRSGTNGTTTETQGIVPEYVTNFSRILIGRIPNEEANLGALATDLNEGGRAWAKLS